jgi:single-stranded-DNA-specific exonuclease
MEKEEKALEEQIKIISKKFLELSKKKEIEIISHFDTDGITSASIIIKTLKKLDKTFSVRILKRLEKEFIEKLPKEKIILFLDLASGSLTHLKNSEIEDIFIIDHHEIFQEIPEKINIINPHLHQNQQISGAGLTYLFCKELLKEAQEFSKLAIVGMIGDRMEKEIGKINNGILNDGEIKTKRGALIYPSTRPLNRVLEFCSNPYIPGVTGNIKGVLELLRDSGISQKEQGGYKSLIELDEKEMQRLVTSIMVRNPKTRSKDLLGDIFLIKLFNKLEDAREMSAKINACSRYGEPETAIQLCLENPHAKKRAETIHAKYKQFLISGLKFASETKKIIGKNFAIINAGEEIKDTMIGTIISILSNSKVFEEGTILIGMASSENKTKISARSVGDCGKNLRELLTKITEKIGGEVGGHEFAAGCLIEKEKEKEFIEIFKKTLELEIVKI